MSNPDKICPSPTPSPSLQPELNQIFTHRNGTTVSQLKYQDSPLKTRGKSHPDAEYNPGTKHPCITHTSYQWNQPNQWSYFGNKFIRCPKTRSQSPARHNLHRNIFQRIIHERRSRTTNPQNYSPNICIWRWPWLNPKWRSWRRGGIAKKKRTRWKVTKGWRISPFTATKILVLSASLVLSLISSSDEVKKQNFLTLFATCLMDISPKKQFYIMVSKFGRSSTQIQNNMIIYIAGGLPAIIIECGTLG